MGLLEVLGLTRPRSMPGAAPTEDERERANARKLIEVLARNYEKNLAAAKADVDAQPVAALKKTLESELGSLRDGKAGSMRSTRRPAPGA
jgi:hypothetical protein